MSGIKSTSGSTPPRPVDTGQGTATSQQQVAPVAASSPSGGHSGPAVPQASSISQLSEGAMIAAIVTARATGGDTMLHAEIGNFRMSANSQLPVGSHVVLEVEAMDDVITARIIAINGEKLASPPAVTLLPTLSANTAPAPQYGTAPTAQPQELQSGLQNLTTVLGKTTGHPSSSGTAPQAAPSLPVPPAPVPAQTDIKPQTYGNTSVPIPEIGLKGSTPVTGQSQNSGAALYAHAPTPGPKIPPINSPQQQTLLNADTATKTPAAPSLQTAPELVKATIQSPPFSNRIDLSSGPKAITQGSQITLIASPASTTSQPAANIGTVVTGTVIGRSSIPTMTAGAATTQMHVQTINLGTISYATSSPPQVGAHVSFSVLEELQQFPLLSAPATTGLFKTPHLPLMSEWGNLRDAMNVVAAQDPVQAAALLNSRIPSPNNQLGASLLFFLAAINGGSLDKWLGQDFRQSLQSAGRLDLLGNLEDDFASLVRINTETGGQEWKALSFPFFDGEALRQLRMFYRQHHADPEHEEEDTTRFVIELDLSQTGPVQLDGLFKKSRFDLVFRSQLPLAEELQQQVTSIFNDNLEITGIKGSLLFKRTVPFPVHPTEEWENTGPDILNA